MCVVRWTLDFQKNNQFYLGHVCVCRCFLSGGGRCRTGVSLPTGEDLKAQVEELKDTDALTQALRELAVEFPSLLRPLIHERDEYMVMQLRMMGMRPGVRSVVAVVGAGHCQGMRDKWEAEIHLEVRRRASASTSHHLTRR